MMVTAVKAKMEGLQHVRYINSESQNNKAGRPCI